MDAARADILAARHRLATQGWVAPKSEAFRHLKPPPVEAWLGSDVEAPAACEAPPLAGAGWTLQPVGSRPGGSVEARWLDAFDAQQRAELFAGLPSPEHGDAAPFAWAHRSLCRQGLRLHIGGDSSGRVDTAWLQLRRKPQTSVEAPLLVVDLADGARCVLIEVHERDAAGCSHRITQNLQAHLRLGRGATLVHLRLAMPGVADQWAHFVDARLGPGARYEQVLVGAGSAYHLQQVGLELHAARATARLGSVLFAPGAALELRVQASHRAEYTTSAVDALALAAGDARAVVNAHARIAPGAAQADLRQRLTGIPTGGQPRIVLRPQLEIHHDQVQATHGATWGALPEDALFYARQRGLDETQARALVIGGMAQAVVARALGDAEVATASGVDAWIAQGVARHLAENEGDDDG